jgi:hypothetical protein
MIMLLAVSGHGGAKTGAAEEKGVTIVARAGPRVMGAILAVGQSWRAAAT